MVQETLRSALVQAPADDDEQALVAALASADDPVRSAQALAKLMDRYKRLAYGVAMQTVRNRMVADDVFQETFVRMVSWLRSRSGIEVVSFPRLLCAFIHRTARELARTGKVHEMPLEELEAVPSISLVDSIYARQLLASLDEPARGILERTILRGMSSREAARDLGLTPENVRVIRHRALRLLRAQQAKDLADLEIVIPV